MVTDYERAWIRLQALIADKSQHGRGELLEQMAKLADECQVPSGELSRLLRLYGVEVERARSMNQEGPAGSASSGGDGVPAGTVGSRGIIDQNGGHDVSSNGRAGH